MCCMLCLFKVCLLSSTAFTGVILTMYGNDDVLATFTWGTTIGGLLSKMEFSCILVLVHSVEIGESEFCTDPFANVITSSGGGGGGGGGGDGSGGIGL